MRAVCYRFMKRANGNNGVSEKGSDLDGKARVELNITEIKAYQGWGCQETHMGWPMAHTRL